MDKELTLLERFTLILLHQSAFKQAGELRSWKGYDWDIMNRLHAAGLITNPVGKAKSVFLTDEGEQLAEALLAEFRGPGEAPRPAPRAGCECGCGEDAPGGGFRPGHDQKLRVLLESQVGGLLGLRDLVEAAGAHAAGRTTAEELAQVVRACFGKRRGPPTSR